MTVPSQENVENCMDGFEPDYRRPPGGILSILDIEIYSDNNEWAKDRYLVHGIDGVLWTSDIDTALAFLRVSILEADKALGR